VPTLGSPTLSEAVARHARARIRARTLVEGLDEAAFHHAAPGGGWSVARCLEHLVVAGQTMADRLEAAVEQGRREGRLAGATAARAPVRLGWFARFFIRATGPGRPGEAPGMKVATREPFDPGDPAARGRNRDAVLADFLALQDQLDALAIAADGLDLAGIQVESVLARWIRIPLGGWFLAVAGHQERHRDQAERARAAAGAST
jgi:hypothetical protein